MAIDQGDLRLEQIREYHEYLRQMFGLLVTWFIFFVSIMTTGYSWVLVSDARRHVARFIRQIGTFFLVQLALGVAAISTVAWYFRTAGETVRMMTQAAGFAGAPLPFPTDTVLVVCMLMGITLLANIGFWLWLMFFRAPVISVSSVLPTPSE